jgi:hypothetical protein
MMMLWTPRSAGRRLVANRAVTNSRRLRGVLSLRIPGTDKLIQKRLLTSTLPASAPHPPRAKSTNTHHNVSAILIDINRIDGRFKLPVRCLSAANPILDLNFDDSDPGPLDLDLSDAFEPNHPPPSNRDNYPPRKEKKGGPDDANIIPKQSSQAARILFYSIAPHVEFRTLHQLTKQLTKMISRGQHHLFDNDNTRSGKKETLKRRLGTLFERDKSSNSEQYSWSLKSHQWIEPLLYQFLMGKFMDNPEMHRKDAGDHKEKGVSPSKTLAYQSEPTFPPNRNRVEYQKHLQTLLQARDMSLQHPMFWTEKAMSDSGYFIKTGKQKGKNILPPKTDDLHLSRQIHSEKTQDQLTQEGEFVLDMLIKKLPEPHFERLMRELRRFAEVDGNLAEQKRGSWYIDDDDINSTPSKVQKAGKIQPLKEIAPKDTKQNKITVLGTTLYKISPTHSHMVAVELGRYFYVDVLKSGGDKIKMMAAQKTAVEETGGEDEKKQSSAEEASPTEMIAIRPQDALRAIRKHGKLSDTERKYQKLRDKFVERMVHLQHEFTSWEDSEVDSGVPNDNIDDSSDDVSSDLMVKEFQLEQMKYKDDVKKHHEESLAETLLELRKMGLRSDEDVKKRRGRRKKGICLIDFIDRACLKDSYSNHPTWEQIPSGTHLRFTAVKIEEDTPLASPELSEMEAELEQRIVFINNLPIDTTHEEIDQIYSRCGPLADIQLFNLRPELDPGPLTKKQLEERQRKQRLSNADSYAQYQKSRQRPKTPVYGILRFNTAEGFNLATSPEMRLFGCVIRRHPVMSIKPCDMKTLYLENIPQKLLSVELEFKLAQLFQPHKMHVMQDGMRGVGNGGYQFESDRKTDDDQEEYSEPTSCEVKFENFHAASAAYDWMKGGDGVGERSIALFMGSDECEVHWFRTPANKMKYWTRELNF